MGVKSTSYILTATFPYVPTLAATITSPGLSLNSRVGSSISKRVVQTLAISLFYLSSTNIYMSS